MHGSRTIGRFAATWWRPNRPLFLILAVYAFASLMVASYWRIPIDVTLYSEPFLLFGAATAVLSFSFIAAEVMFEKPTRLFVAVVTRVRECQLERRLIIGVPVALVLPSFFSLFTSLKGGISRIVPFYADATLIAIDRAIFGADAWRVLQPIVGFPIVTFALNLGYNVWFIAMMTTLFCVTFMVGDDRFRLRYLITFVLAWVLLGNVLATLFASVGPCFYSQFGGQPVFADLMAYLHGVNAQFPVWALDGQGSLLASHGAGGPSLGAGISAFPSMHVAVSALNGIAASRLGRVWCALAWTFAVLIAAGSVALGWHYAVDGLCAVAGVYAIWRLSDRIACSE